MANKERNDCLETALAANSKTKGSSILDIYNSFSYTEAFLQNVPKAETQGHKQQTNYNYQTTNL